MSRKRKNRRKERINLFIGLIFIIILALFIFDLLEYTFTPKHPNYEYEFKEYIISSGERLWDIAEEELKSNPYYEGDEVRQIIYEIEKDNKINSNQIKAGQVIKIRIIKDGLSDTDQSVDKPSKTN